MKCINAGNWVDSAQDRDYWRALVISALNLRGPFAMELVIINIVVYELCISIGDFESVYYLKIITISMENY